MGSFIVSRIRWSMIGAMLSSVILLPQHCLAGISIGEIYGPLSLDSGWPPQSEGGACWSPDGTKIVFSWGDGYTAWDASFGRPNPDGCYIVIMTADGQAIRGPDNPLVNHVGWDNHSPDWGPDHGPYPNWIVYAGTRVGPAYIARVNPDDGTIVQIPGMIGGHPKLPKWSPDGTKIAYLGGDWHASPNPYHICLTDPDGSFHENLTQNMTVYEEGVYGLSWSPDGSQIVFTQYGLSGLFVLDVATRNVTELPGFPSDLVPGTPVWCPDGDSILFRADGGIYCYQIDTQETEQLTYGPGDSLGDWHPTAGLAFSSARGCTVRWDSNIYTANPLLEPTIILVLDAPTEAKMGYPYRVDIEVIALDSWPGGEASIRVTENRGPTHAPWDIHDNEYWHSYIWGGEWKQRPEAKCEVYVWDKSLNDWSLKDDYYEFGVESILVNLEPGETARCYFTAYHRWYWLEPWDWDRVVEILGVIGLDLIAPGAGTGTLIGKQVAEALKGQQEIIYNYTATCGGSEANDTTTVKVPTEKYILLSESVVFHALGSLATTMALEPPGPHTPALLVLEGTYIVLGEAWYVLASDPPDFNYAEVAAPQVPNILELDQISDPGYREAADKTLELVATGIALRISLERYEGAKIDDMSQYMALQMEAARSYAKKMVELAGWLSDFWGPISVNLQIPTAQQVQEVRQSLLQDGLPKLEVAVLSSFGYSPEQMRQIAQTVASLPDEYFTSPEKIGDALDVIVDSATEYVGYIPGPGLVDDLVGVSVGRVGYDRRTGQFSVNVTVTNISDTVIGSPVWLVIESISSPSVTVANADDTTYDAKPYLDLSGLLGDGQLDPRESVITRVYFNNPSRVRFTFEASVRGMIL